MSVVKLFRRVTVCKSVLKQIKVCIKLYMNVVCLDPILPLYFSVSYHQQCQHDSHTKIPVPIAVYKFCMVTGIRNLGYRVDDWVIKSRKGQKVFLFSVDSGAQTAPYWTGPGFSLPPGNNATGTWNWPSPPSSVVVMYACSHTSSS
jgi:hypothetical protein